MLEIAVIGAGASGLVASRHLMGYGLRPCIFEATKGVGGAWSLPVTNSTYNNNQNNDSNRQQQTKMWNGLTTNLSKYTCRFSDWPWADETPTFPSTIDMGRYLEGYSQNFLDPTCFHYECQVTNIEAATTSASATATAAGGSKGYRVEWTDLATSTRHSKEFEGVVVASGFFSKPYLPKGLDWEDSITQRQVLHSSEYESCTKFHDQTVVVVGSAFSALEIAVDVSRVAKRVIHILPRIPWVLPRYVPFQQNSQTKTTDDVQSTILPVDLALYRRTKDAPQLPEVVTMSSDMAKMRHEALHSIVGHRQKNSPLGIPTNWEEPPLVAISDYYLDLIIQGDIEVIHGRFSGLRLPGKDDDDDNPSHSSSWEVKTSVGEFISIHDVDTVICATGYESCLDEFLHTDILKTLKYDANDRFCPMTSCWETFHPDLPNLFFCGMYRGPYMGIMEQQGRLAAQILSGNVELKDSTMEEGLDRSNMIRSQPPIQPQFPHFDYVGFLDTLNSLQKKNTFPSSHLQKGDMVVPAFYQDDDAISKKESEELDEQVRLGQDGSRIPAIVLSAIIGEWNFDRRIVHLTENRQEHVYGTVKFTRPMLDYVLYREDGLYELTPTKLLNVFREYEYQVAGDCLEIYFVESGQRAHLFLSLKFSQQKEQGNHWVATSDHLCIKDLYMARFDVELNGLAATNIRMTYRVQGPTKDYESTTVLSPIAIQQETGVGVPR